MTYEIVTAPAVFELDRAVALHALVFHADGDEVTVGRRDIDSYGIFPADGAELVRQLAAGMTPREAAAWYHGVYGERVDVMDVLAVLSELQLVRTSDELTGGVLVVRWQRLGRAAFSPLAMAAYAVLVAWCVAAMVRSPELAPHYRNLFFTGSYTIVLVGLLVGQLPGLLLHEGFHALAGRRLGLRSSLTVSRRLYFVVLETALDGLVTVPRRKRYLPILAGMLADVLWLATLTLVAEHSRTADGSLSITGRVCLALAFGTLLRIVWQFYFYLQTDLYALVCVVLGCVNLQVTAKRTLRNRLDRFRGHEVRYDDTSWHPADRSTAKWYSWLLLIGYAFTIGSLVLVMAPTAYYLFSAVLGRFAAGSNATTVQVADSVTFLAVTLAQLLVAALLVIRDHRRRARIRPSEHLVA